MLKARTVVLVLLMVFFGTGNYPTSVIGIGVLALFVLSGLVQHRMVGTKRERQWQGASLVWH